MSESTINLPADWTERAAEQQSEQTLAEFRSQTDTDTTFTVSIHRPSDVEGYRMRFSTFVPESKQPRHEYPVAEYETRTAALEATESFIDHVTARFRDGSLSRDEPDIDAVRTTIEDFTHHRPFASIRRLTRLLSQ